MSEFVAAGWIAIAFLGLESGLWKGVYRADPREGAKWIGTAILALLVLALWLGDLIDVVAVSYGIFAVTAASACLYAILVRHSRQTAVLWGTVGYLWLVLLVDHVTGLADDSVVLFGFLVVSAVVLGPILYVRS